MVVQLLQELKQIGCTLRADGGSLKVAGALTDGQRLLIKQHKAELLELLKPEALPVIDFQLEGKAAADLMELQGWVAIRSYALGGETVLFVRNDNVQVPTEYKGCARYATDELRALAAEPRPDQEGLQKLHQAKEAFQWNNQGK